MLLSRHRDADILKELARHLGFEIVRGSTFGGGSSALRRIAAQEPAMNLAITPDGPRGPRRVSAQGPVYLSSKLGMPLVAMGIGYDRPWRLNSWDRFAVPRPFSRARAVLSPQMFIPPDLDRDGRRALSAASRADAQSPDAQGAGLGRGRHAQARRSACPGRGLAPAPAGTPLSRRSGAACDRAGRELLRCLMPPRIGPVATADILRRRYIETRRTTHSTFGPSWIHGFRRSLHVRQAMRPLSGFCRSAN